MTVSTGKNCRVLRNFAVPKKLVKLTEITMKDAQCIVKIQTIFIQSANICSMQLCKWQLVGQTLIQVVNL